MAQLSRLAQLYLRISDNLTEDDVRNLRSLLSFDEILGKANVEKATPLEIFNMLVDNDTIGRGKLGLLVEILRCLGKGKLANEAEDLEQEERQKIEGSKSHDTTGRTTEQGTSAAIVTRGSGPDDSELEDTEVRKIISVKNSPGASNTDEQKTTEATGDTALHCVTTELASLHIREMEQLEDEPMKAPGLGPSEADSSTDTARLETLLAELDTPAVMADQEKQCDLYCQMGDLYRAKLYIVNSQSALQYYQSMLECSRSRLDNKKLAKAHNRLGLTYDMLGKHKEALENHERALDIIKVEGEKVDSCVAYKNLASSLTLSGKVSDAKNNYKTALRLASDTRNKIEEIDIHCKLGDLHRQHLNAPHVSHKYYTKMLELAKDSGSKYWKMQAYNRLGLAFEDMQDNELALEWHQKALMMSKESADKRDLIISHMNVGILQGRLNQSSPHLDTALQMAEQKGDQYGQMSVYMHMGDLQREKFNSPRTSLQYYEQYLSLARQVGDRREEGWAYNRLGLAHYEIRGYEVALEWYEKHLKISEERNDKKEEVTAHAAVGNASRCLGKIEQAKSHFDKALQMAQQTEDQHGQMDVYCKMGDLQRGQLHSPRTAIQYYEQYLALARQLLNSVEEAFAYERLGLAHYEMGEYEKALEWHQKHLDKSQDNGDNKEQISAHTSLGRAYRLLGSPEKATSHISTALQMAEQTGDLHGQMKVYFSMGEMHEEQLHSPRAAIQYYDQYLALAGQLGERHEEGVAYSRLGLSHSKMREYEKALEWHQKHLKASQESRDKKEQIRALRNVGNTYRLLGKLDQAKSYFDTALQMAQQTGDQQGQMLLYYYMGEMQREQLHSPRTAIQYYEQYLTIAGKLGDRHKERVAYNKLGVTHFALREYETALEWHQKDLEASQESGDKKEQITALRIVGDTYSLLGKLDQARSHFDTALQMAQQTGDLHGQMEVNCAMGDLHREQLHSPRTAIQYYEQYITLARQLGNRHEEGVACKKMGLVHDDMREHETALEWFQQYLKVSQESGNKLEEITAHTAVGKAYGALSKVDEATSHFGTALKMSQETGNQYKEMEVCFYMGEMQKDHLHSPRTAIQYYEQYLALARQLGDRHEEEVACNTLGLAHYEIDEYQVALDWFQKGLKSSQESGHMKNQKAININIASCYQKLSSLD